MLTFEEWLKAYTEKYGTPPAVVMAEDAWFYAKEQENIESYGFPSDETSLSLSVNME